MVAFLVLPTQHPWFAPGVSSCSGSLCLPQPPSSMGVPDFVPSRVPLSVPLCPPPLSLSATCLGPSTWPLMLSVPSVYTVSPLSRGASLPGEGCGLSPAALLASAVPLLRPPDTQSQVRNAGRDRFLYRPALRTAPAPAAGGRGPGSFAPGIGPP